MASSRKPTSQESDPEPITDAQEMQDAVALPTVIDPPQILDFPQPGFTPSLTGVPAGVPNKRVRILRSERSATAGGAHYSLNAGDIMVLPLPVADGLIAQRLAEEI